MKIKCLLLTAFILAAASMGFAATDRYFTGDLADLTRNAPVELSELHSGLLSPKLQNRYSLTITNRSKWDIYEVYVHTSEDKESWGEEQLAGRVLKTDTYIVIASLKPGEYDVKFVDEGNDECILENIAITKNTSWALTTKWLENCATR